MRARGSYPKNYPYGSVIHFTSGRWLGGLDKAFDTIEGGIVNGFLYMCISYDGKLIQTNPLNEWGYNAGESGWSKFSKLIKGTVSDELIGIEQNCAGKVKKLKDGRYETWFNTFLTEDEVRYVTEKEYGCPTGYYHKLSRDQELTLTKTLLWLKANNPDVFDLDLVVAHHEVAGTLGIGYFRKDDVGGSLSMSMKDYRAYLKAEYKKEYGVSV